jgi:hypothetical protein
MAHSGSRRYLRVIFFHYGAVVNVLSNVTAHGRDSSCFLFPRVVIRPVEGGVANAYNGPEVSGNLQRAAAAVLCFFLAPCGCSEGSRLSGDAGAEEGTDAVDAADDDAAPDVEDPEVLACISDYGGCWCEPGCLGGYSDYVWYPSDAGGPFPSVVPPPQELLDVAVARYVCAICECIETWEVRRDGVWREVDGEAMCRWIVEYDGACGGCLERWAGFGE